MRRTASFRVKGRAASTPGRAADERVRDISTQHHQPAAHHLAGDARAGRVNVTDLAEDATMPPAAVALQQEIVIGRRNQRPGG